MYQHAVTVQQSCVQAYGFRKGTVPLEYIAQNFKSSLLEHLKEFLFNYFVISVLYKQIRAQRLHFWRTRLTNIHIELNKPAIFDFEMSMLPSIAIQEWKYLPFKAPKRKKYKDLDRQVESFIKDELTFLEKHSVDSAHMGDW